MAASGIAVGFEWMPFSHGFVLWEYPARSTSRPPPRPDSGSGWRDSYKLMPITRMNPMTRTTRTAERRRRTRYAACWPATRSYRRCWRFYSENEIAKIATTNPVKGFAPVPPRSSPG